MNKYFKQFLIASIAIIFSLSAASFIGSKIGLASHTASQCLNHDLIGYGWSDNIGWISISCKNAGNEHTVNYGVDKAQNGDLSGYAWSDNIGWINFNPAGPYPSAPNHGAKITGNSVKGWARALSYGGGWDGWIDFDPQKGGVTLNASNSEFEGYAWAGDDNDSEAVVGWISFNCNSGGVNGANICNTLNYKVSLTNSPPLASISCSSSDCIGFALVPQGVSGSLDAIYSATDAEDSASDIVCAFEVKNDSDLSVINLISNCVSNTTLISGLSKGDYTAKVIATDTKGLTDEKLKSFTLIQDIVAEFECSLDGILFKNCSNLGEITTENTIYFNPDSSIPSQGATIISWSWDFNNDGIEDSTLRYPNTKLSKIGNNIITLTAIDDNQVKGSRSDNIQKTLNILLPLPIYKEIVPNN